MPRHIKTQQKDAGVVICPSHRDSRSITEHAAKRLKAIKSSPDLTHKIPVSIPELRAIIFINPGEDAEMAVAYYKASINNSVLVSKNKGVALSFVEE